MRSYEAVYDEICCYENRHGVHFDYIFLASSTNATQSGLLAEVCVREMTAGSWGSPFPEMPQEAGKSSPEISENMQKNSTEHFRTIWKTISILQIPYMEGGYWVHGQNRQQI